MPLHETAFYFSVFFISGLALASFGVNVWIVFVLAFVLASFLCFKKKAALAALSLFIAVGFFYFHFHSAAGSEEIVFDKQVVFSGVLTSAPESRLKSQKLDIELSPPYRGKVSVYLPLHPEFTYGDLIEFKGRVSKSPSGRANMSVFPVAVLVSARNGSKTKEYLFKIKDSLVASLRSALPPHKSALASGLIFGERAEFSDEFEEAMRRSGTTHIVALSGFNISIIALMVSGTLGFFLSRRKSFYFSVVFIILFVLMTGAEASVVRAGIMGIIMMLAAQSSRAYSFRNAVSVTALTMLLLNPRLLVFDVGFQLSFAALMGIVYLEPVFRKHWPLKKDDPGFMNWRDNFRQTSAAQIAVLPIILPVFGYFSPLSLAANVLILGLIPTTMLFGFITSVVGLVSLNLSIAPALLTGALLSYETLIINLFAFNWI